MIGRRTAICLNSNFSPNQSVEVEEHTLLIILEINKYSHEAERFNNTAAPAQYL